MSDLSAIRTQVRSRANFACEFCGVTEASAGGQLTIDHFRPKSKGGSDTLDNLLYCCVRCNQYKQDYWPAHSKEPRIWNPLVESASLHFIEGAEGELIPLGPIGEFTIRRLRLNRPPLIAYRQDKRRHAEETRSLNQYKNLVRLLEQTNAQLTEQLTEQQQLLKAQRDLLIFLLRRNT